MKHIKKKCWPENFEQILAGKKNVDVRLADFDIKEGDVLIFEEYNPETKKYTGRVISKKVKNLNKVNPIKYWPIEAIKNFGFYEMEFE